MSDPKTLYSILQERRTRSSEDGYACLSFTAFCEVMYFFKEKPSAILDTDNEHMQLYVYDTRVSLPIHNNELRVSYKLRMIKQCGHPSLPVRDPEDGTPYELWAQCLFCHGLNPRMLNKNHILTEQDACDYLFCAGFSRQLNDDRRTIPKEDVSKPSEALRTRYFKFS